MSEDAHPSPPPAVGAASEMIDEGQDPSIALMPLEQLARKVLADLDKQNGTNYCRLLDAALRMFLAFWAILHLVTLIFPALP